MFKESAFTIFNEDNSFVEKFPKYEFLFKRNWWFISYVLGVNVGYSFVCDNNLKSIFIRNKTKIPFITSDNPAINVHPSLGHMPQGKGPKYLDLYYPLSPKFAYMINDSNFYNSFEHSISEEDVTNLNNKIAVKANKTLYSNAGKALKIYAKFIST